MNNIDASCKWIISKGKNLGLKVYNIILNIMVLSIIGWKNVIKSKLLQLEGDSFPGAICLCGGLPSWGMGVGCLSCWGCPFRIAWNFSFFQGVETLGFVIPQWNVELWAVRDGRPWRGALGPRPSRGEYYTKGGLIVQNFTLIVRLEYSLELRNFVVWNP